MCKQTPRRHADEKIGPSNVPQTGFVRHQGRTSTTERADTERPRRHVGSWLTSWTDRCRPSVSAIGAWCLRPRRAAAPLRTSENPVALVQRAKDHLALLRLEGCSAGRRRYRVIAELRHEHARLVSRFPAPRGGPCSRAGAAAAPSLERALVSTKSGALQLGHSRAGSRGLPITASRGLASRRRSF